MKTLVLIFSLLLTQVSTAINPSKKVLAVADKNIELNLSAFCNYLQNGSPHEIEGIYATADSRYLLALIKNDANTHDFIGVVIAADNPYWKKGAVKFNFVLTEEDRLKGYYYHSNGDLSPVEFQLKANHQIGNQLQKMDIDRVVIGTLAYQSE